MIVSSLLLASNPSMPEYLFLSVAVMFSKYLKHLLPSMWLCLSKGATNLGEITKEMSNHCINLTLTGCLLEGCRDYHAHGLAKQAMKSNASTARP